MKRKRRAIDKFLNRAWEIHENIIRLEWRLEREYAEAYRISNTLSDMSNAPHGKKISNTTHDAWALIMDSNDLYLQNLKKLYQEEANIEKFITRVESKSKNTRMTLILRMRYVDLMKWTDIAHLLDTDLRNTYRIHDRALNFANRLYIHEKREVEKQ